MEPLPLLDQLILRMLHQQLDFPRIPAEPTVAEVPQQEQIQVREPVRIRRQEPRAIRSRLKESLAIPQAPAVV